MVDEREGYYDEEDEVIDIFQGEVMPEFTFAKVTEPVLQARKRHYSESEDTTPQPEESKIPNRPNFRSTNHQYESYADIVFETD